MMEGVARWLSGDPKGADEIFQRYSARLIAIAEQRLSRRMAGRTSGEDVVQSVFHSFFHRAARGEFKIDTSLELWQLLVQMTVNKVRMKARHHTAERRDVSSEAAGEENVDQLLSRDPSPEDVAVFLDQIDVILSGLPDEYSRIFFLRLEGRTQSEIAESLGLSRPTIRRALSLLQQRLDRSNRSPG